MGLKSLSCAIVAAALVTTACGQTDAGITTAVKTKFAADKDVSAYQIDVDTRDKVVTLSGSVETPMSRTRAVEIARSTDGVARVIDNLTVTPPVATTPTEPDAARAAYTDPALTAAVKTKLLADTMVGGLRIDVDTQDAVVTLTGNVKTQQEREKALQLARETDGVKGVTDRLTIKP